MTYKRLFIWVEGYKDQRFFEAKIKDKFEEKYDWVEIRTWAEMSKKKVCAFLRTIEKMGDDYIFVTDIDNFPCITSRKAKITSKCSDIDENKIVIVRSEIEGWYLAGLDSDESKRFKIKDFEDTEKITKEHFNKMCLKKFEHAIPFMIEILDSYCMDTACKKNDSFDYFVNKYGLLA